MSQQIIIPLAISLPSLAEFSGDENAEMVAAIRQQLTGAQAYQQIYIWGAKGLGKSHLLQAACHEFNQGKAQYINLQTMGDGFAVDPLPGGLLAFDNLQALTQGHEAEFLSVLEQHQQNAGLLLFASTSRPRDSALELADLRSRLERAISYRLHAMSDIEKAEALILRAQHRGIDLDTKAANFMITHSNRDSEALFQLLDRLDNFSMAQKKQKISVPMIRRLLTS